MELDEFLVSILLGGLCILGFLSFFLGFVSVNNIANNPSNSQIETYLVDLNSTLSNTYSDYNSTEAAFSESNPSVDSGFIVIDAISGMWKTLKKTPSTIINLTAGLVKGNLLSSAVFSVVFGVILSIFTVLLIVMVVRFIRT